MEARVTGPARPIAAAKTGCGGGGWARGGGLHAARPDRRSRESGGSRGRADGGGIDLRVWSGRWPNRWRDETGEHRLLQPAGRLAYLSPDLPLRAALCHDLSPGPPGQRVFGSRDRRRTLRPILRRPGRIRQGGDPGVAGVAGTGRISVNRRAAAFVERLEAETAALGVDVHRLANGTRVVD